MKMKTSAQWRFRNKKHGTQNEMVLLLALNKLGFAESKCKDRISSSWKTTIKSKLGFVCGFFNMLLLIFDVIMKS